MPLLLLLLLLLLAACGTEGSALPAFFSSSAMPRLLLLLLAACGTEGSALPATPFALAEQLVPAVGSVAIYSPRDGAHFEKCGAVTIHFEAVGLGPGRQAALVRVGDANPTPVRLDGDGVLSLTAHLSEPGVFPVSVTVLTSDRTPAADVPPARISVSCGHPRQAPCTLDRLRVWEAAVRGNVHNPLPPSAFAAEHLAATDAGAQCAEEPGSGSFSEGVHALFALAEASGDGAQRVAAGLEGLRRSAAAGGFNAPALLALLGDAGGFAEAPGAVRRLQECVRATRGGGAASGSAVRGAEARAPENARAGHPLCHLALAFRLWHGLGTPMDVGSAALHYKYAAELAMRTVDPMYVPHARVCVCVCVCVVLFARFLVLVFLSCSP